MAPPAEGLLRDVVAVTMVRDEEDIVYACLVNLYRHGARFFVVADNLSTDGTVRELMRFKASFPDACLVILNDPEEGFFQSRKMTALAKFGAQYFSRDLIYPFDADEFLCTADQARIPGAQPAPAEVELDALRQGRCDFLLLDWRSCLETADGTVLAAAVPASFRKTIIRWKDELIVSQGNHKAISSRSRFFSARPRKLRLRRSSLRVLHFPVRGFEQLRAKIVSGGRANQVNPEKNGTHWHTLFAAWERQGDAAIRDLHALIVDPGATFADFQSYAASYRLEVGKLAYFADYFGPRTTLDFRIPR